MTYAKSDIEEKLAQLATIIAQRTDGIVYLPLYQRLEEELARCESELSAMERVMQRAGHAGQMHFSIAA